MVKVYGNVNDVWKAQMHDIENAKKSIYYEQYVHECVTGNGIGRQYIDLMIKKAKEGLKVHSIFDAIGSMELFDNNTCADELSRAGVKFYFYKILGRTSSLLRPFRLVLRDHRKLLIVDDSLLWIGGVVVNENMRNAQDLMVRFDEAHVAQLTRAEYQLQFKRLSERGSLIAPLIRLSPLTYLVGNAPGIGNRFCYERLCHAIMLARSHVTLLTPYFAPPYKLRRIIQSAIKRGVCVTLVISEHTDNILADIGREPYIDGLMKMGMKVKYNSVLNHGKAIIVDNEWVTIGSTNIDILSLIFNHELNIETTDTTIISGVLTALDTWKSGIKDVKRNETNYASFPLYKRLFAEIIKYAV